MNSNRKNNLVAMILGIVAGAAMVVGSVMLLLLVLSNDKATLAHNGFTQSVFVFISVAGIIVGGGLVAVSFFTKHDWPVLFFFTLGLAAIVLFAIQFTANMVASVNIYSLVCAILAVAAGVLGIVLKPAENNI